MFVYIINSNVYLPKIKLNHILNRQNYSNQFYSKFKVYKTSTDCFNEIFECLKTCNCLIVCFSLKYPIVIYVEFKYIGTNSSVKVYFHPTSRILLANRWVFKIDLFTLFIPTPILGQSRLNNFFATSSKIFCHTTIKLFFDTPSPQNNGTSNPIFSHAAGPNFLTIHPQNMGCKSRNTTVRQFVPSISLLN